jgi:hypothetical protein
MSVVNSAPFPGGLEKTYAAVPSVSNGRASQVNETSHRNPTGNEVIIASHLTFSSMKARRYRGTKSMKILSPELIVGTKKSLWSEA